MSINTLNTSPLNYTVLDGDDTRKYKGLDTYCYRTSIALTCLTDSDYAEKHVLVIAMVDGEAELWVVDTVSNPDPAAAIKALYDDGDEFPHQITVLKTLSTINHPVPYAR